MKGGNKPHFYVPSVFAVWVLFEMTKLKENKCCNSNLIVELKDITHPWSDSS